MAYKLERFQAETTQAPTLEFIAWEVFAYILLVLPPQFLIL